VASLPEIGFLRRVLYFKDVEEPVLLALWPSFRERRLKKGDVLFRAGDPGEELFLIRDGSIVVSKPVTGRVEQVLSRLASGEVFGEMSVFGDERRRSATCQAEIDTMLYSLDRDSLNRFVTGSPLAAASSSSRWRRSPSSGCATRPIWWPKSRAGGWRRRASTSSTSSGPGPRS